MAKEIYEMFAHQFAYTKLRKLKMFLPTKPEDISPSGIIRTEWNPEYWAISAAIDLLQNKTPYIAKYKSLRNRYELADAQKKGKEIKTEWAMHIYLAQKAGVKISGHILRTIPELEQLAKENSWDELPVPDIKTSNKKKKEKKPEPVRELQDDIIDPIIKQEKELGDW